MIDLMVTPEKLAAFRANGELEVNGGRQYFPNEYCTLTDETNPKRTALTKVDATGTKLIPIIDCREGVWGIKPRNREQHFAFDALLDDAQALRPYFPYARVKEGVLDVTAKLFGVTYRQVKDAPVWHPSVDCYEMLEDGKLVGRFYLDMHPRRNKFSHAAHFRIRGGVKGTVCD